MNDALLWRKIKVGVVYSVGVCLTPVAVIGVATVALVVFVADKLENIMNAAPLSTVDQKSGFS